MQRTSRRIAPEATAALELFDMVVSGPLRAVHANTDGSWTVVPVTGPALVLTGADQVSAYIDRTAAHDETPAEPPAEPASMADTDGCGCAPAPAPSGARTVDIMQARAIAARMGEYGITSARLSVDYDADAQAATVRILTDHGLYALHIPPRGRPFPVYRDAVRDGALDARRVPATHDSTVAVLLAGYLRDRGAL